MLLWTLDYKGTRTLELFQIAKFRQVEKIRQWTVLPTAELVYFAYFHSIISYGFPL